jgi:alkylhydroperoxidase family enzyme
VAPGALDAATMEMIYLARRHQPVRLLHCVDTATAPKAGITDAIFAELLAVVGMANETNRLASGYQVEIDERIL